MNTLKKDYEQRVEALEVKLMKKKNQKREEEEKERRLSSSVSEEKHKIGNETRNTTSSTTPTTSLDGVGDEGKTTSLDKPPADKWTRLEFLGEMEEGRLWSKQTTVAIPCQTTSSW